MKRASWLHGLRATLRGAANGHKRGRNWRSLATRRATFEPLEDRTLLALLTVNSPLDNNTPGDGLVTLREAIIAANSNTTTDLGHTASDADTIQFTPSVTGTIALVFGEFAITQSLSINGPGRDVLTIDAHNDSRVFHYTATAGDLTISDLSLTRGRVTGGGNVAGGAIHKVGSGFLALDEVNITASSAVTSGSSSRASGGGIYFEGSALTVTASSLSGNYVQGNHLQGGGAIAARTRTINVTNSTIHNNQALGSSHGGGIWATFDYGSISGVLLTLTGSTISGNTANGAGGGVSLNAGVITDGTIAGNFAIQEFGGGVSSSIGELVLRRVTVRGNQSIVGGGIGSDGQITLDSSTLSSNTSENGGAGIYSRGSISLMNSTVSGNTTMRGKGGGLAADNSITLAHSTVTNNSSMQGDAGGVYTQNGTLRALSSMIAGNTAFAMNPDLRSAANIYALDYSIIGNAVGTSLVEAQTPDARGNRIGSSAGAGIIDPKLAPLANNGGPTQTHALLSGSPAIDANLFPPFPALSRDYPINGSLADALSGPPLTAVGGTIQGNLYYGFGANQGLNASNALPNPANYTLEMVFRWTNFSGAWQKIIDFHNLTSNVGLYTVDHGLHFVNGPFVANVLTTDFVRLVLTRDDATDIVRTFLDGEEIWSFVDAAGDAVFDGPNQIIRFFQDDTVTGQIEAASGQVDSIRIYNAALTPAQVSMLPNPIAVPVFDQRGTPFQRVRDGDGSGGAQMDIGAYESHTAPAGNNTSPVFTSPDSVNVPENATSVLTVVAFDADVPPQPITYSIAGGVDQSKFSITSEGALSFVTPPDFEAPTDANLDNSYIVIVEASEGSLTSLQAIVVRVMPVNDNSPVFTSPAAATVMENITSVMTILATDADLPAQSLTLSIAGGADQARFALASGQLAFIAPPDFESPADADGDSIYEVVVQADDGNGRTTQQAIVVTVMGPPADYGDAPDVTIGTGAGNYNTRGTDRGPRHTIVPGLRIGASVDGETGTLQNAAANADDVNAALPDDEDGVANPAADLVLTIGAQPTVNVRVTNTTGTGATLYGWIDYNADGVFDNATERASIPVPNGTNNGIVTLVFPAVPAGFTGTTYARLRLSTDAAAANSTGAATDGEVEDYRASITNVARPFADSSKTKLLASGSNGVPFFDSDDYFGRAVVSIGDLDGDGVTDLAVGASGDDTGGPQGGSNQRGAVNVLFMNPDGTVRSSRKIAHNLNGGPALPDFSSFGRSIANLGDLDGDGVTDLAVGVFEYKNQNLPGGVYILFMKTDGTVKNRQLIASGIDGGPTLGSKDRFGESVTSLGDLDGDGVIDMAVGAIGDSGGYRGAVHVLFMNSNGTVKTSQKIANGIGGGPTIAPSDVFGVAIASMGDLDGDGITDLAVGASDDDTGIDGGGAVHVLFLNANGTAKSRQKIASGTGGGPQFETSIHFGDSLASLGDMDGDGIADLAVGAAGEDGPGIDYANHGAVYMLLMNPDGTVKSSQKITRNTNGGPPLGSDHLFGQALASLGDLDGDGVSDLAVAARVPRAVYVLFLKPINTNPVIIAPTTASVPENSTAVLIVTATDAQMPPQMVTFSIAGGTDSTKFTTTSDGMLTFRAPPDFDAPSDSNGDNVYVVAVQASDGHGGAAVHTIHVTVTPVNDNAPVFTSADLANVPENTTNVLTVTATDADLPPQTVTYSLVGGSDQSKFNITSGGALSFNSPPDFESPTDLNGDNVYIVIVEASDGSLTNLQAILVTVTNTSEAPLPGDYNNTGTVDIADYVVWRNALGQSVTLPNDATPGSVTQADYDVWRANFGRTATSSPLRIPVRDRERSSQPISTQIVASPPSLTSLWFETPTPRMVRTRSIGRDAFSPVASHHGALLAWLASRGTCLHRELAAAGKFDSLEAPTDHLLPSSLPMDSLDMAFATLGT